MKYILFFALIFFSFDCTSQVKFNDYNFEFVTSGYTRISVSYTVDGQKITPKTDSVSTPLIIQVKKEKDLLYLKNLNPVIPDEIHQLKFKGSFKDGYCTLEYSNEKETVLINPALGFIIISIPNGMGKINHYFGTNETSLLR